MAAALVVGVGGGALNAFAVARLDIPPLIVTLGTLSLFRGIAEGLTRGAVNYTGFPRAFLALGQGYLGGVIPTQVPLFLPLPPRTHALLHRSVVGRAWYAIGFSAAGARYAGMPVARRGRLRCTCCPALVASVAAIVYVAHLGQAKSDAGPGTSSTRSPRSCWAARRCSAGAGRSWGTVLGLAALSVLRNGLHLAALPSELTGVLTGALLVADDCDRSAGGPAPPRRRTVGGGDSGEEQSGRGALRRDLAGSLHRRRHQRLAGPLARLRGRRGLPRRARTAARCRSR